jgi:hypothetical protein
VRNTDKRRMPRDNRRGWHVRDNVWNVSGLAHAGMVSREKNVTNRR